jgi:hypothetical protein
VHMSILYYSATEPQSMKLLTVVCAHTHVYMCVRVVKYMDKHVSTMKPRSCVHKWKEADSNEIGIHFSKH